MAPIIKEIAKIKRGNYANENQLILDLKTNIKFTSNTFIDVARDAFVDTMIETSKLMNMDLNKILNKGIYILCWINRYIHFYLVFTFFALRAFCSVVRIFS